MNILIATGLPDHKLENILDGIAQVSDIESIYLVRRKPFQREGVIGVYPPRWMRRVILLAEIYRFTAILLLVLRKRIDLLVGIYTFPHSFYLAVASRLFKKKLIISFIEDPSKHDQNPLFKMILKSCSYCFVRGYSSKEYLMGQGIEEKRVAVLKDIIDFDVQDGEPVEKCYDMVFVAYLTKAKRVDRLCEIISKVSARRPSLRVGIVGDGPYRGRLESLIKKHRIENYAQLLGFQKDVYHSIKKSEIFILCSDTEGLPFVLIEALICSVPSVVFDIGNISDILQHEVNAMIADPYNTDQFAQYCLNLLENVELYNRLVQNIQITCDEIQKDYTVENIALSWQKAFAEIHG